MARTFAKSNQYGWGVCWAVGSGEEGYLLGSSSCFSSKQEYFLHTYFPRGLTGSSPHLPHLQGGGAVWSGQAFILLPVEIN